MSRVKHIKRADRGYRNNTHYQTRAMLHRGLFIGCRRR